MLTNHKIKLQHCISHLARRGDFNLLVLSSGFSKSLDSRRNFSSEFNHVTIYARSVMIIGKAFYQLILQRFKTKHSFFERAFIKSQQHNKSAIKVETSKGLPETCFLLTLLWHAQAHEQWSCSEGPISKLLRIEIFNQPFSLRVTPRIYTVIMW